jgi:CBS domain-containing protein
MDSTTLRSPIETLNPPKPVCVSVGTRLDEVLKIMKEKRIGCVCVVRDRQLAGIFTERDVLKRVVGAGLDVKKVQIEEVMTATPEYLYIDDQIAFALNRMDLGGFRHILLINTQGEPSGVISVRDIMAHLVKNVAESDS